MFDQVQNCCTTNWATAYRPHMYKIIICMRTTHGSTRVPFDPSTIIVS